MWQNTKKSAQKRNLLFDLTPAYFDSLEMLDICPVLGIRTFSRPSGVGRTDNTPSLDKFYPELGYVKGNVQSISLRANQLNSDGSSEEWDKIAKWCKKKM